MAKLYFRYGTMCSGKTMHLLMNAHNYEESGMKVAIIKPKVDTKGEDYIVTRVGLKRKIDHLIDFNDNIIEIFKDTSDIKCILVDEAQFLESKQVEQLLYIAEMINIPVICYGLRTDFKTNGFSGSIRLLELAHSIEETKTICSCDKKATMIIRKVNDVDTFSGEQVLIDGTNDSIKYEPVCPKCYIKRYQKINSDK